MIRHIIFDVGNVLFAYDPGKIIDALLPETPHRQTYLDRLFLADIWQRLDRGVVSISDAVSFVSGESKYADQHAEDILTLLRCFPLHLDLIEGSKALFEQLLPQYPIYILSNFQNEPFDLLAQTHPFLTQAKGTVVSAKVKMMKPEPNIYHHLLTTYALTPQECVFIDDLPANVQAAEKMGIVGIQFESPNQTALALKNLGLPVTLPL